MHPSASHEPVVLFRNRQYRQKLKEKVDVVHLTALSTAVDCSRVRLLLLSENIHAKRHEAFH